MSFLVASRLTLLLVLAPLGMGRASKESMLLYDLKVADAYGRQVSLDEYRGKAGPQYKHKITYFKRKFFGARLTFNSTTFT